MERISGPSTGSTSGNMLNGNTTSLTPTCGIFIRFRFRSFSFVPSISLRAIRAIGTLQTFDTNGTVRDARGLASRTYTLSWQIAYWMFMTPQTFSSRLIRKVYSSIVLMCFSESVAGGITQAESPE